MIHPLQCNSLFRVIGLNSSFYHYFFLQSFERHIKSQLCSSISKSVNQLVNKSLTFSINQSISQSSCTRLLGYWPCSHSPNYRSALLQFSSSLPLQFSLISPLTSRSSDNNLYFYFIFSPLVSGTSGMGRVDPR